MRDEKALAFQSYNLARELDGMKSVAEEDPRFLAHLKKMEAEDEEFLAESLNEKHMSAEDRAAFDIAQDKALRVWLDNSAWRAVDASEAQEGELIPARMLKKWKPTKDGPVANARVIVQGFRHKDVLENDLDKESPTLSRVGRMLTLQWACQNQWKVFSADVKSAFMQADSIDETTRIYIKPSSDMRRRLEKMMNLREAAKPAFGDVRAPRQWYSTADSFMVNECLFVHRPLDCCLYLSLRRANETDPEFHRIHKDGEIFVVDGILGLHVDDYLGAGECIYGANDAGKSKGDEFEEPINFASRVRLLAQSFRFGTWDFGEEDRLMFCGTAIQQSLNNDSVTLSLQDYTKLKPIPVEKARKSTPDAPLESSERKHLRALIGALAWPSGQCLPPLAASVSIHQASSSAPTIQDCLATNKTLRFAKRWSRNVKEFVLTLRKHGESLEQLRFGVYTDASWSVRPDGSSQGGYLIFVATASAAELESEKPFPLTILDWLPRMCRSSLSAEAQASAGAVDEVEWIKVFAAAMVQPYIEIEKDDTLRLFGETPLITDAKSLFDTAKSVSSGLRLAEKRTAIEVAIVRERMEAMAGYCKWVNSAQQLADGLTKPAARDNFVTQLKRQVHQLKFDPTYIAAKKVTKSDREKEIAEHEEAARYLFGHEALFGDEEDKPPGRCQLPGCEKGVAILNGKETKYCCRRHYYKHVNRAEIREDVWMKSAKVAMTTLALASAPKAEAKNEESDWTFIYTVAVMLCFSFFGMYKFVYQVFLYVKKFVVMQLTVEEELAPSMLGPVAAAGLSHGEMANVQTPEFDMIETNDEAKSSESSTETHVGSEEWGRWHDLREGRKTEKIAKAQGVDGKS